MDTDWFLKVIEGSSVNTDIRLSFGESAWEKTEAESPNSCAENGNGLGNSSQQCEGESTSDDENLDEDELSIASDADDDSIDSGQNNVSYAEDKDATDDGDTENSCDADDNISQCDDNVEGEGELPEAYEETFPTDEENEASNGEECSLVRHCRVEGSVGQGDTFESQEETSDDEETDPTEAESEPDDVPDPAESLSSESVQDSGTSDASDSSVCDGDSLDEFMDGLGDVAADASDEDQDEGDGSLLDFAGELGVVGSDSSDSESADESFASVFSLKPAETVPAQYQEASASATTDSHSKSANNSVQRTDSEISTSSRNSRLRSSLVRRPRVESTRRTRPTSIRSNRSSNISNASSPSLCSMTSPSKLSRTSMNHIPLDRKHSRGWARSSSKSSSSETELPPPPKQSTPQASTQHMELDISEAERSWLPPLAFTEEDHTTKPENKAVGALLKEFVSLRRSVSDEYEIAEKVSVRRKTASVGPGDLPPKPDNDRLQKMGRKRLKVISEIMETEKTYQHHLDMIVKAFEGPLRQNQILPDHIIVTIFSNIRQIININKELWQSLNLMNIGRAFLKMGPFLKLYSTYANNHERALATLMEWDQKSADFSQFRREQEEQEEMAGLKLNALLITPVQRVPRYKLLLTELLENTPTNHEDYPAIQEACRQISAVATHINEHIKQQDNFIKMLAIQKSLSGTAAPRLLIPGRMFIKEGALRKVSKNGTSSRERMFFLFSDILIYAKSKLMESGAHHSYVCCCILPLQHCSVTRVFGHSKEQGALFSISCKQESLLLYSDQKTVTNWMQALTTTIGELLENRQSLRKVSSAKQPLRKAALAKLKKQQKRLDPLRMSQKAAKRHSTRRLQDLAPDSNVGVSQVKKPKLGGSTDCDTPPKVSSPKFDLNCLTPRSRSKKLAKMKENVSKSKLGTPKDPAFLQVPDHGSPIQQQHPIDMDYSEVWKLHNESIVGGENSPSRASFHGLDPCNTPQHKLPGWTMGQGSEVGSPRSSRLTHIGWEEALQTATQTTRLFHPTSTSYNGAYNNLCSIQ